MIKKKITILGSTGSIGKSLINILKKDINRFEILLLTVDNNINELLDNLMSSSSRLKDFLDQRSLKRAQADSSKLTKEEITWIVNFNVHDQWIKQNIEI